MRRALTIIIAAISVLPTEARAGAFDVFGFGAIGIAMGGATTACPRDHTAVFHNPAGLTCAKGTQLGFDIYTAHPDLNISLQRSSLPREIALQPCSIDGPLR